MKTDLQQQQYRQMQQAVQQEKQLLCLNPKQSFWCSPVFFVGDQGHPRPKVGGLLYDALRDADIRSHEGLSQLALPIDVKGEQPLLLSIRSHFRSYLLLVVLAGLLR